MNRKLIILLLFYRLAMAFVAEFFVSDFTYLGDELAFMYGTPAEKYGTVAEMYQRFGLKLFFMKDHLGVTIISSIHRIAHFEVVTACICSLIAYFGIYRFLAAAKSDSKCYTLLILLCFSPSFTIWSSIAGKEALVVFGMGIICAELVKLFKNEPFKPGFLFFLALYLVMVLKKQYIPFVVAMVPYMVFRRCVKFSFKWDFAILMGMTICIALGMYMFRYQLDAYGMQVQDVFRVSARSTRPHIFIEQFDFFKKMPYLIFLAFWGPTWSECHKSVLHLCSFIESGVIVLTFLWMLRGFFCKMAGSFKEYYQWFFLGLNSLFLILFAHYGQGIINPGAGIRYRTNIYLPVVAFIYIFAYLREKDEK